MNIINEVKKVLPRPIRNRLRPLYSLYARWNRRVVLDKQLVQDISEYFNCTCEETILMLKSSSKANNLFWHALHPVTEEEIEQFYRITPFYVFDLAYWHMKKGQRKFRNEVLKTAGGDVLEYGGGIGDLCVRLAERGLNVTYGDVSGLTLEFAQWLFKKRGQSIKVIGLEKEEPCRQYDTIICIDVIEHLTNPEAALQKMAASLKNGGKLIVTNLQALEDFDLHPMHMRLEFDAEELLKSLGLNRTDKDWLWVKTEARKPVELHPALRSGVR